MKNTVRALLVCSLPALALFVSGCNKSSESGAPPPGAINTSGVQGQPGTAKAQKSGMPDMTLYPAPAGQQTGVLAGGAGGGAK